MKALFFYSLQAVAAFSTPFPLNVDFPNYLSRADPVYVGPGIKQAMKALFFYSLHVVAAFSTALSPQN